VTRRADFCSPSSNYMRHRVRLRWREWENIGASGQVVNWTCHGVRVNSIVQFQFPVKTLNHFENILFSI
jgi:hypothetical protein